MNKTIIKSLITISIFAALFVSCSGVNSKPAEEAQKDAFTLTGSFSAPDAASSRSATSSFALDGDFELLAYQNNETPINGTVDTTTSTWSVKLNKTGEWNIVINYKRNNVTLLTGSKKINLESFTSEPASTDCLIKLSSENIENPAGSINLEIQNQTTTVSKVSYVLSGSNLSEPLTQDLSFTNSKAVIKIDSLKEGIYELELYFTKSTGELLYYCKEQLPVYGGYSTDTWYGESSYLVTAAGKTSFVVTEDLLRSFNAPNLLAQGKAPVILYDFNYITDRNSSYFFEEIENHVPGMNIFETVTNNQKLGTGITLAKNKNVNEFTIDPVTQAIYTIESIETSKGMIYKVVSYPSYAGYEYGKVIYSQRDKSLYYLYAYDGYVYVIDSNDVLTRISPNGETRSFYIYDENDNYLSYPYEFNLFAVYGDYVYSAMTVTSDLSDDKKFVFVFDKFAIFENAGSEEGYIQRVQSREFDFSSTELPCDISCDDMYYSAAPKITDLQIIPDSTDNQKLNIYALFTTEKCEGYSNICVSYGGLLKISTENSDTSSFEMQSFSQNKNVLGWYTGSGHSNTETNQNEWFYGPRKFIARKQDELVIADEGAYISDSQTKNRNRVVTVNLNTFAMSAVDVETSFSNYASLSSSYSGKYGDEN